MEWHQVFQGLEGEELRYFFETYGCQMNIAESAALRLALEQRGWHRANKAEEADLVIVNTCSVRATAEQRAFARIALLNSMKRKAGPKSFKLLVTGCMATRLGKSLNADFVMGTLEKAKFPGILEAIEQARTEVQDSEEEQAGYFAPLHYEEGTVRSFVPISHGCNNFCSYCIVPYTRGPEVARAPAAILAEVKQLAATKTRELVLLGQNVNSYHWQGTDFPQLLEQIAAAIEGTNIGWVRFLSSHPKDLSDRTIEVMARHPCFCRHLHLCVQHGSDAVLYAMNRGYTSADYLVLVAKLREALPGLSLSTDVLIGFPGETEADFEATMNLLREVRFLYAYTYHFNPREGTAAFDLPNRVPDSVQSRRLSELIALQKEISRDLLGERVGTRVCVLIEGFAKDGKLLCRTERDEMLVIPGESDRIGNFTEVVIEELRGNTFIGKEDLWKH